MGVDPARHVEADHGRLEVRIAEDEGTGHHAVAQDPPIVIEVPQKMVDRGDALPDAPLDLDPFASRQDAWDEVERQHAIDRVAIGVDGEGDAEVEQLGLREGGAPAEFRKVEARHPSANRPHRLVRDAGSREVLAEEPALVVAVEERRPVRGARGPFR